VWRMSGGSVEAHGQAAGAREPVARPTGPRESPGMRQSSHKLATHRAPARHRGRHQPSTNPSPTSPPHRRDGAHERATDEWTACRISKTGTHGKRDTAARDGEMRMSGDPHQPRGVVAQTRPHFLASPSPPAPAAGLASTSSSS